MSEGITFFYWLMGISGAIIFLLLSIVGFFIKSRNKEREKSFSDLIIKIDNLVTKTESLLSEFKIEKERQLHRDINCKDKHKSIDGKLSDFAQRIYKIETNMIIINKKKP